MPGVGSRRLLYGLARLTARLALPVLYALAETLLWLLHDILGYQRRLARDNLERAFPDLSESARRRLARESYRRSLQTLVESLKALRIDKAELRRRVIIDNPEAITQWIRAGRPVVAAAAHLGNWEWHQLAVTASVDCPTAALYKRLSHPVLDRLMLDLRSRFGTRMFAQDAVRGLLRERGQPRLIGMVADQGPQPHEDKHWATFLGIETAFYKGPEQIARLLDCPLYFARMRRVGRGRYRVRFECLTESPAQAGPGELMDRYVAAVERAVRAAPQDWVWVYKRWKYARPRPEQGADEGLI
jgi:KDO2-lipid IV(A) lauroyltransferase